MNRGKLTKVGSAALCVWLTTCGDDVPGPIEPLSTPENIDVQWAVSEPVASSVHVVAQSGANSLSSDGTVYVAFAAGEQRDWESVRLTNLTSGLADPTRYAVVDGGVDPIAIAGDVGDTLQIDVVRIDGSVALRKAAVPVKRAPRVVRTSPARGRTDVAVNARILIVFSEPIDPGTLTAQTVKLFKGSELVEGMVALDGSITLSAEFAPAQPLLPNTAYALVVERGVRDLSGDQLEQSVNAQFQTEDTVSVPSFQIAFPSCSEAVAGLGCMQTRISVINSDGTGEHGVGTASDTVIHVRWSGGIVDMSPSWSPDGRKIVFTQFTCPDGALSCPESEDRDVLASRWRHVFVMNADGTGIVQLTDGPAYWDSPSWSPDGARILAAGPGGLNVMNADGSNLTAVPNTQEGLFPAWSPDGLQIAFVIDSDDFEIYQLNIVNVDGSGLVTLLDGHFNHPTWSPDGSKILFERHDVGFGNVQEIDVASGAIVEITSGHCPARSPDGSLIAVLPLGGGSYLSQPPYSLLLVNLKGDLVRTINTASGPFCRLAWSPVPL
jgi:TolB protein